MIIDSLKRTIPEMDRLKEGEEAQLCDYLFDCTFRGNKICFKGYSEHCRIKSFYNRWGRNYIPFQKLPNRLVQINNLGIGASDSETAKRIRKNLDQLLKEDLGDY